MNSEQQYIDLYRESRDALMAGSDDVMNAARDKAFGDFCRLGLPTKKVERYKYIDVQGVLPVVGVEAAGSMALSISEAVKKNPDFIAGFYGQLASTETDALTALNTMFAQDSLFIHIKKNTRASELLEIENPAERVLIILEEGAELRLLFHYTTKQKETFPVQVIEAFVGDNAHLDFYSIEDTDTGSVRFSNLYIKEGRNSNVSHNQITLRNGVTRNMINLMFCGEGGECSLNGCVIADRKQFVDNNTLIVHRVGHCTSNELYKYVLNDEAVGAFAGRVLVEKGAQKTVSQETNQNLCGSKTARMFTQPMLEIYADDVKCSHGSTVGQMNDAVLFYMQQRGIPIKEARLLLQHAFVNEVLDKIGYEPLKERLSELVEMRFRE